MMMAKKAQLLIEYELEFLEEKLRELKEYIQKNPFNNLEDRIKWKELKGGKTMPMVIASKEAQRKDLTQALKDYAEILRTVEAMREKEASKSIEVRGKVELSSEAEDFLNNRSAGN
jgi:hypothetical protein